jgi:hypothetical protein
VSAGGSCLSRILFRFAQRHFKSFVACFDPVPSMSDAQKIVWVISAGKRGFIGFSGCNEESVGGIKG